MFYNAIMQQVIEVNWDHDPSSILDISDATNPVDVTFRFLVQGLGLGSKVQDKRDATLGLGSKV